MDESLEQLLLEDSQQHSVSMTLKTLEHSVTCFLMKVNGQHSIEEKAKMPTTMQPEDFGTE